MSLGRNIKNRRKEQGLSQKELAHNVNVTQSFVSKMERDENTTTYDVLRKIAKALDTTVEDLVGNTYFDDFGANTLQDMEYLHTTHQFNDMIRLFNHASGAEFFQNPHNRHQLLLWKAIAYSGIHDYASAVEICTYLLEKVQSNQDRKFLATVHAILSTCYIATNDIELARKHVLKAHGYIEYDSITDSNKRLHGIVLINLGMVYTRMNRFEDAMRHLGKAYEMIDQDIHAQVSESAKILFTMASMSFQQKRYEESIQFAKDARRHHRFIRDVSGQIETLNHIAYVLRVMEREEEAVEYYTMAVELATKHPDSVAPNVRKELREQGYDV